MRAAWWVVAVVLAGARVAHAQWEDTRLYGRAGTLELGGSAGIGGASNFARFELSPSIGVFVADHVQLSLLGGLNHMRVSGTPTRAGETMTEVRALLEPSLHLPLAEQVFAFLGIGGGVAYLENRGTGLAVQPRLGTNILVGTSGVVTLALTASFSTLEALRTPGGTLEDPRGGAYGGSIGYTVLY